VDSARSVALSASVEAPTQEGTRDRPCGCPQPVVSSGWEGRTGRRGTDSWRICRCLEDGEKMGAIITDGQRIAHLDQKVESLDRRVNDLRRSVEVLNTLIDEIRIEQIRMVVRSHGVAVGDED
jgi:hypothetical protein